MKVFRPVRHYSAMHIKNIIGFIKNEPDHNLEKKVIDKKVEKKIEKKVDARQQIDYDGRSFHSVSIDIKDCNVLELNDDLKYGSIIDNMTYSDDVPNIKHVGKHIHHEDNKNLANDIKSNDSHFSRASRFSHISRLSRNSRLSRQSRHSRCSRNRKRYKKHRHTRNSSYRNDKRQVKIYKKNKRKI